MKRISAKVHFLAGLFVIMAVIVCSPAATWALGVLDFNMDAIHDGASITYSGGILTGTNISVESVAGLNTPVTGLKSITNGLLSFTATGGTGTAATGWNFTGGEIHITGSFGNSTGYLLDGVLSPSSVAISTVTMPDGTTKIGWNIVSAKFTDTKNIAIVEYFYGTPHPPLDKFAGWMNLSFMTINPHDNSFSTDDTSSDGTHGLVLSGDLSNISTVPLPGAVWLLGAGLVGLVGVRRRMLKKG